MIKSFQRLWNESQLNEFFTEVNDFIVRQKFVLRDQGQQEREFTKEQVGPALQKFLNDTLRSQITLRFDGELSALPLIRYGMKFYPDAQLSFRTQRILSVEVKIIRDSDASGSLSKAIGQTLMYRALGYECSIGLILDARSNSADSLSDSLEFIDTQLSRTKFVLFNSNPNLH